LDLKSYGTLLISPHLPSAEAQNLKRLSDQFALPDHIWIASSGSTRTTHNSIKLIALSHHALKTSAKSVNTHLSASSSDRWLRTLPLWHVGGLGVEIRAKAIGCAFFQMPTDKWNANQFIEEVEKNSITLSSLVPTQIYDLVQTKKRAPQTLRAIVVGGSALSIGLYKQARELNWPLLPSFGMTEVCSQIATATLASLDEDKFPGLELLEHVQTQIDEQDLLLIKSESLMTGWAQIQNGQPVFSAVDGWYTSQDRVDLSRIGGKTYLQPKGRDLHYIKILGEGVSISELQEIWENIVGQSEFKQTVLYFRKHERNENEIVLFLEKYDKGIISFIKKYNEIAKPYEKIKYIIEKPIRRSELGKVLWMELFEIQNNELKIELTNDLK
jgi:o-succinylbenzoate---CoA ligase